MTADVVRVVCRFGHVVHWPAALRPLPDRCPVKTDNEGGRCRSPMHAGVLLEDGEVPPWMKPSAAWFYGHRDIDSLIQWEPGLSDDHTILYEIDTTQTGRTEEAQ